MTTRLFEVITKLENRWRESDRLSRIARKNKKPSNNYLLNGVSIVLQTAHFEASLKEICEAIIEDINNNSCVHLLSDVAKSIYLSRLFGDSETKLGSKEGREGILKIMKWVFDDRLSLNKDIFSDTESNPRPEVIKRLSKQFGVSNFFIELSTTRVEFWLSTNEAADFNGEILRMKNHIKKSTRNFPYRVSSAEMSFNENPRIEQESGTSLFNNLNNSLKYRNMVAHSGLMEEIISVTDVKTAELTFRSITLYFIALICIKIADNQAH
jgi:RiboL-PSP-HEPN